MKPCDRDDCTEPATKEPVFLLYAALPCTTPTRVETGLAVCDAHVGVMEPADLIDEACWKVLTLHFVLQTRELPVRDLTELVFDDLDDLEAAHEPA